MVAKKIWAIIVVSLLLVGIAGICYGEDNQKPQAPQGLQGAPLDQVKLNEEFGKALDELIAVKVINVQQKTTIITYFEKALKVTKVMDQKTMVDLRKQGNDPLSLLVKEGVINQDQAAVIARILPRPLHMPGRKGWGPGHRQIPPDPEKMKAEMQKKLDDLVGSKVITDKQKITILKYFSVKFDKMKDHSPDSHSEKNKDFNGQRKSPLNLLVKDGEISQEQADAIAKVLFQPQVPMDKESNSEHPQP